ncbi:hypothetical protein QAD02_013157 [Eretmocerus hayati]|uniref:Uncharacterized protein n=1 Tax=Eretmocerus hayati TaxID=131215 RepID=A0ACC2P6G3_9HYME|nr:hypothetical protein QAD02_013157 [Eretmocerus hayati]
MRIYPQKKKYQLKLENHEPQLKPSLIPFRAVSLDEYEQICKPELPACKRNNKKSNKRRGRPLKRRRSTPRKANNASKPKRSRLEDNSPQIGDFSDDPEIKNLEKKIEQLHELGRKYKLQIFESIGEIIFDEVALVNIKIESRKRSLKAAIPSSTQNECPRCGILVDNSKRSGL